jgi:spermidine synthase
MRILVMALFFLSGASGLVLETVWFRQLALIFGSTSQAAGTVTAAFLGGLGLGAWLAAIWVDRLRRRVMVYGLLELIVGAYALISPMVIAALNAAQAHWLADAALSPGAYAALRFGVIFLALLPATTAMGATLPLLTRALTQREMQVGQRIGALYGINTLGAFAGVLLAGFGLVPFFGQALATALAGGLSLFVGSLAAAAGLLLINPDAPAPRDLKADNRAKPLRPYTLLALFVFISGLSAMLIQVGFQRVLAVVLGSSVYSFTLTVGIFLAGIGIGSLLYAAILVRKVEPFKLLAITQLMLAGGVLAAVIVSDKLPALLLHYAHSGLVGVPMVFFVHAGLVALVLFVPALAMGISLPTAMRMISAGVGRLGRDVGWAYGLNTLGSIVGSFMAAFVLIPALGLQATIMYAAGLAVMFAALFAASQGGLLNKRRALILVPIAMLISTLLPFWPSWDVGRLTAGMFRLGIAARVAPEEGVPRGSMLYYRDGPVATVSVEQLGEIVTMRVNGKVEASNRFDMPTQALVGLLPILFHGEDAGQNAALIGYGSGVTAGAMLAAPIESLTAVELEPKVVEASEFFNTVNFKPQSDPRLKLVIGDARTVLGYGKTQYDVIVSEPSNPWVAGAGSLFTVDFYKLMREKLKSGGVYAQWIQLYELAPEHLRALVRSFSEAFPNVLIFTSSSRGMDLVLLGREQPWELPLRKLVERANNGQVEEVLQSVGVGGGLDILSLVAVTPSEAMAFTGPGLLNSDDNGLIEFSAPKDMLFYQDFRQDALDFHFRDNRGDLLPLLTDLGDSKAERAESLGNLALHLLAHGRTETAFKVAEQAQAEVASYRLAREVQDVAELIYLEREFWPPVPNAWLLEEKDERFAQLAVTMVFPEAEEGLRMATELARESADKRLLLIKGVQALKALKFELAYATLKPLAENEALRADQPMVDFYLGRAADRLMKFSEAVRYLARFNDWRVKNGLPIRYQPDTVQEETIELAPDGEPAQE